MAIVKINNYGSSNNLTNVAVNVDYDRLTEDKTDISVNYGTTPATVSILVGSILEVNGNRYVVQTANESFQMSNAAHNYITVTDNGGTDANPLTFDSASTLGTFSATKQGFYQTGNLIRTLKHYIDQDNEYDFILLDVLHSNRIQTIKSFDRIKMNISTNQTSSGIIQFDTTVFDELSRFNTGTYRYTAVESGYYYIILNGYITGAATNLCNLYIRVNGSNVTNMFVRGNNTIYPSGGVSTLQFLDKDDYIDFYANLAAATLSNSTDGTFCCIFRLL